VLFHTKHTFHTNILDLTIEMDNNGTIVEPSNFEMENSQLSENPATNPPITEQTTRTLITIKEISRPNRAKSSLQVIIPETFSGEN